MPGTQQLWAVVGDTINSSCVLPAGQKQGVSHCTHPPPGSLGASCRWGPSPRLHAHAQLHQTNARPLTTVPPKQSTTSSKAGSHILDLQAPDWPGRRSVPMLRVNSRLAAEDAAGAAHDSRPLRALWAVCLMRGIVTLLSASCAHTSVLLTLPTGMSLGTATARAVFLAVAV